MFSIICKGNRNLEEHFPYSNWFVVLSLQFVVAASYSVVAPSLYQFVTTPPQPPDDIEETGQYWPGLGGTATDYGWIVALGPLLGTLLLPLIACVTHYLPYRVLILTSLSLYICGGVIYGFSDSLWMLYLAMGIRGVAQSLCPAVLHTYMGVMGTKMDNLRTKEQKKPRKFLVYIAFSLIFNGSVLVTYAISSIVAQFEDLDPYHWPGWFMAAIAAVVAGAILLCFRETRNLQHLRNTCTKCSYSSRFKLSLQLKNIKCFSVLYILACMMVNGMAYSVLFSLITPVLSDSFGLTVEYISYFFMGVSCAFLASSFIQIGAKAKKTDNRIMLGFSLICALFGSLLCGDWQAIGNNPCSYTNTSNITDYNDCTASFTCTNNSTNLSMFVRSCEAISSSSDECFWNPKSRITGEFCNSCVSVCLSKEKSIDIYQFGLGVVFLSFSASLGFIFLSAVMSDITPVDTQGVMLSILLGTGIFSRGISPYWFVETYEWTDRHIFFPMAIVSTVSLILLVLFLLFYKRLAPYQRATQEKISATNELTSSNSNGDISTAI